MAEYLYPGVYVEEIATGNEPIEGVSTSIAGFFGVAERGPLTATLVTSFSDYALMYGGYVNENGVDRCLTYAVEGFFQNGGQECFIVRCASSTSVNASVTAGGLVVTSIGPGVNGNRIAMIITNGSQMAATQAAAGSSIHVPLGDCFKLTIVYWSPSISVPGLNGVTGVTGGPLPVDPTDPANRTNKDARQPTVVEAYDNLNLNTASPNYVLTSVNGVSTLVTVAAASPPTGISTVAITLLGGTQPGSVAGSDGTLPLVPNDFTGVGDLSGSQVSPGGKKGLAAFEDVEEISILCCPDEYYFASAQDSLFVSQAIVDQCETNKFRFAILQSPPHPPPPGSHFPTVPSQYAAYYYPWLNIVNPVTGLTVLIPPGGHIAGIYARSDTNRNVAKTPANEPILMIDSLQVPISNSQQALLNPVGVNALRYFRASGNLVWGGRTTSPDPDWRYIGVRRLFIFVEKSIEQGTQWVVFEPNDTPLWARVIRSVSDFLTGLWMNGMLQGSTKEQAYFVRCDRTTMTQADIENGRLIMVIGIAPLYPAEFVIFRIGQWDGGSSVTES